MKIVFPEYKNPTIQEAFKTHELMRKNGLNIKFSPQDNLPLSEFEAIPANSLAEACAMVKSGQADAMIAGIDFSSRDVILACRDHFGMAKLPNALIELNQHGATPTLTKAETPKPSEPAKPQIANSSPNPDKSAFHIPADSNKPADQPAPAESKPSFSLPLPPTPPTQTISSANLPAKAPEKSVRTLPNMVKSLQKYVERVKPGHKPSATTSNIDFTPQVNYSTFSGLAVMNKNEQTYLLADMAACKHPTKEQLVEIIYQTHASAKKLLDEEPRIALLSFSTNGSGGHDDTIDLIKSVLAEVKSSTMLIDGEMQLDAAVDPAVGQKKFPGSPVAGRANVLIAPDLNSGNLIYKTFERIGYFTVAGPILQGFNYPVSDLSRGSTPTDIILTIECMVRLLKK